MAQYTENITREQLLNILDSSFERIALVDMRRALEENTTMVVFILGSCFIEALSGFYFGQISRDDRENEKRGIPRSGERFKGFVQRYLSEYNPEDLWNSLRCGLVHSYTDKGAYLFKNKDRALHHLKEFGDRLFINDEDFFASLEQAYMKFKLDILAENNNELFLKAKRRLDALGLTFIVYHNN